MPYPNMPKSLWAKMERCVARVKVKHTGVKPYAVCYKSLMGKKKKGRNKKPSNFKKAISNIRKNL